MSSLIEKLREKVIEGGGYADIHGEDLEALIQQTERTQALYDQLMEDFDRLRTDTDAAIRARLSGYVVQVDAEGRIVLAPRDADQ